jgi:hypothetical protein
VRGLIGVRGCTWGGRRRRVGLPVVARPRVVA